MILFELDNVQKKHIIWFDNVLCSTAKEMPALRRKAYERLLLWKKSPSKRAVLVTGARQIGKTYLIRKFGRDNYDQVVEVNFLLESRTHELFEGARSPQDILMRLSLAKNARIEPGKTLLFLDEIQEHPEILTAVKGLVDQGEYDIALSGSLLGVELRDIKSNPVGYSAIIDMFPMDFEEFCWALNASDDVFAELRRCLAAEEPVDRQIHELMMDLFRKYLVVGGMPDAVRTFVESNDLSMVRDVQDAVRSWYRADIAKYCPDSDKLKAKEAFDLVPSELSNPNKRFVLKSLNENARFRSYEDALLWLTHANVALAAYNVDELAGPLLASKSRNLFKLFYADVGLLSSAYSRSASLDILSASGEQNHGSTYENAIAQELRARGFDLYYYNSKKRGEIDFAVEDADGRVVPLEVKSGKSYKRHRAMSNVLEVDNYHLEEGIVLGPGNIERSGKILYLPVYMAGMIARN